MCGLAGCSGVSDNHTRARLVKALGEAIDHRGGHAIGYASRSRRGALRDGRRLGTWKEAGHQFRQGPAAGSLFTMLHSRYATSGDKGIGGAHPFKIVRNGVEVLIGAHNGTVSDAYKSAYEHGRSIAVDSQEIFELIADKEWDSLKKMHGYGVATWVDVAEPDCVYLLKLTNSGSIEAASLKGGGVVWGSTWEIIFDGLQASKQQLDSAVKLETGKVYRIKSDWLYHTGIEGIELGFASSYYGGYTGYGGLDDPDDYCDYGYMTRGDYRNHGKTHSLMKGESRGDMTWGPGKRWSRRQQCFIDEKEFELEQALDAWEKNEKRRKLEKEQAELEAELAKLEAEAPKEYIRVHTPDGTRLVDPDDYALEQLINKHVEGFSNENGASNGSLNIREYLEQLAKESEHDDDASYAEE